MCCSLLLGHCTQQFRKTASQIIIILFIFFLTRQKALTSDWWFRNAASWSFKTFANQLFWITYQTAKMFVYLFIQCSMHMYHFSGVTEVIFFIHAIPWIRKAECREEQRGRACKREGGDTVEKTHTVIQSRLASEETVYTQQYWKWNVCSAAQRER